MAEISAFIVVPGAERGFFVQLVRSSGVSEKIAYFSSKAAACAWLATDADEWKAQQMTASNMRGLAKSPALRPVSKPCFDEIGHVRATTFTSIILTGHVQAVR